MLKKLFLGLLTIFLIPLLVNEVHEWRHRIQPNKVIGYLPYANDYHYANGRTYKGASPSPEENMPRPIDPKDPVPLKFGAPEYKLTLGIRNLNTMQLVNVYLFLKFPKGVKVTKYDSWDKNSETEYYTRLGTINPDMLVRDPRPIWIAVDKPGPYALTYDISGNLPIIRDRRLVIDVYK